jgi:hypothetical protein
MTAEFAKQLMATESLRALLAILVLVAGLVVWKRVSSAFSARISGWKNLADQFPAPEIERPGDIFKRMTGWIDNMEFDRGFTLQSLQEGLLVRPYFAKRSPILIPWLKFSEVHVCEGPFLGYKQNLLLKVQCDKPVQFALPPDVLQFIEKYIPAGCFHTVKIAGSIGELLKERWKNRNT